MQRMNNTAGLLLLMFLAYNFSEWTISANTGNILSKTFMRIMCILPEELIYFIFLSIIVSYIKSLLNNEKPLPLDIISLALIYILAKISLNMLILEDSTLFVLFEIHHPIPFEIREVIDVVYEAVQNTSPGDSYKHITLPARENTLNTILRTPLVPLTIVACVGAMGVLQILKTIVWVLRASHPK